MSSVKDRLGLAMIRDAEEKGRLGPDNLIVTRFDMTAVRIGQDGSGRPPWWNKPGARLGVRTRLKSDANIIDKGIPTTNLLSQVLVAKYADHLPLYRQEKIFGRAGLAIARSTLAQWVGQTGVQLQPLVDALREAVAESARKTTAIYT